MKTYADPADGASRYESTVVNVVRGLLIFTFAVFVLWGAAWGARAAGFHEASIDSYYSVSSSHWNVFAAALGAVLGGILGALVGLVYTFAGEVLVTVFLAARKYLRNG